MNPYFTLALTIIFEIIATTSLKLSEGFTKPIPSVLVLIGYASAFYLLSLTLKPIPLGTAYAIWSGLGPAGAVIAGVVLWRESIDLPRVIGIILIIAGVVVLNTFAKGTPA